MTAFSFELVSPERVLWTGTASAVSMRTDIGEVTFLANHSPLVGAMDICVLRIDVASEDAAGDDDETPVHGDSSGAAPGSEVRAAVHGGFVLVNENKVTLASGVAELADEIDVARARRALEAATERLAEEKVEPEAAAGEEAETGQAGAVGGPGSASAAFFDPRSAEAALRRAKVRIEAAGESVEQVA